LSAGRADVKPWKGKGAEIMARSSGAARQPTQRKPPTPVRRRRRVSTPDPPAANLDGRLAFTYAEVARELECSERLVQQLVADRKLAVFYVGPQTPRISRAALIEFMAKGGVR
jgi:excisionase family DNA binding protein